MPTNNPRITVTLAPGTHAQLRRLSELTGNSQSALVSELLDASAPVFDRTIRILEAASQAKVEMGEKVKGDLEHAQAKLEKQLGIVFEVYEDVTRPLLKEAEAVRRRARRERASGLPAAAAARKSGGATPLSNRGVRSQGKTAKKSTRRRG